LAGGVDWIKDFGLGRGGNFPCAAAAAAVLRGYEGRGLVGKSFAAEVETQSHNNLFPPGPLG
jgi:hypothetical protein